MAKKQKQVAKPKPNPTPSRLLLLRALQEMSDEAWGWFVLWAGGQVIQYPDGLGGFTPASRAAIERLREEAAAYLQQATGGQ